MLNTAKRKKKVTSRIDNIFVYNKFYSFVCEVVFIGGAFMAYDYERVFEV